MQIRIGTRGSKLALWQANHVSGLLEKEGVKTTIIPIETTGDKILDVTISKIGDKGVFTQEIEIQLKKGTIDIAVHSAKDMPSMLADEFELIAFSKREKANDVLVSHQAIDLDQPLVLGTSSTRRIAFLNKYYPHIKSVPVRGNLQTRIRKMEDGACDGLWLAYAGVHRMEFDHLIRHQFDMDKIVPAVGQGSMAIECMTTLPTELKEIIVKTVNDDTTKTCITAERAFLKKMDGGCSIPVFGYARIDQGVIAMRGGIISLDGQKIVENTCTSTLNSVQKVGATLADYVLENGGAEILREINMK